MSAATEVICNRGRFFIETGSSYQFKQFLSRSAEKIVRAVPEVLLKRIEDLINQGNRDDAVTLWIKVCAVADELPARRRRVIFFYISYFVIGATAVIALIRTL